MVVLEAQVYVAALGDLDEAEVLADYAEAVPDGEGSVEGMAQDPVAVAASNNPLLKTLVAAVSGQLNPKVDLVDTLNGGQFTVPPALGALRAVSGSSVWTGPVRLLGDPVSNTVTVGAAGAELRAGRRAPVRSPRSAKSLTSRAGMLRVLRSPRRSRRRIVRRSVFRR